MKVYIIQNWASESAGTTVDYLEKKSIPYEIIHSYKGDPMPKVSEVEAALVMGCPISVNRYREHEFLKNLYEFMTKAVAAGTPLLGTCLGSQMLAMVLGARVHRNPVREIGIFDVQLTETGSLDRIFDGFKDRFPVFQWHNDTFDIPENARHLAEGEHCPNQAFRKGNAVGIQFHLESRVEDIPRWCDEYADELAEEELAGDKIIDDFKQKAETLRKINFLLLDNFFNV
jgi:GMP synthase-like glutamine amidotransferase